MSGALTTLAREQADRGQFKEAESSYRKALSIDPLDISALNGLIALYRQQGMTSKVQLTIAQLTPAQRSALGASLKHIEASMLQDQADLRLAKGEVNRAIKYLEQAIQVDADDPWLHLKLAKLYVRQNDPASGLAIFDELLARHPNDPDSLYALAQFQSDLGDSSNARKTFNRIEASQRSHDMLMLQQRLTISNLAQDAKSLMQSGRKDDAIEMLSDAEATSSGNEDFTLAVALAWAEIGDIKHSRTLFDRVKVDHTPPSVNWHLRYASFLAMIDSDQELREELETISGIQNLSPAERASLAELQESAAIRMAEKQTSAGNTVLAHQTLAPFLKQKPDQENLLLADAHAYRAERHWQDAMDIYARTLKLDKLNKEARSGLIEMLTASGERAKALQQLDEWAADSAANEVYVGLPISSMYSDLGEYDRAKKLIDSLIAAHPEATYVLYDAWKMAQREGQLDHEIDYLKKLVVAEPYVRPGATRDAVSTQNGSQQKPALAYENIGIDEFGSPDKIQRDWKEKKLAALIDRRSDWLSSAIESRSRKGTPGMSQYNSLEIPLEYKTPWHKNDELFFRTDLVRLSSGTVATTNDRFGSLLLCQPTCASTMLRQTEQGMSFTAGYQRGDLSADIGFTPLNFPVSNTVGAIRQKGDLGEYGYSLEASRRAVTGSLLSFAGTKDPNTGRVWGGVVATGGRFGLSLDKGETFGFWSSFGWHNLTGLNVQSNQRIQIMAGEQWRVVNEENRVFSLGLTGMYLHHSQNAGEYTFGHGGYYSPRNYRSLSLPITYAERWPRFSYMLRGSVSASNTQMQDAQFFPTDSSMQAQATALAPLNFTTPIYTGGTSQGKGFSIKAAWEYQFEPKLFAGGLLSIDRSDFYAPNRALIYLRYSFDHPGAQPVFMPPEPMEPSSQF
ncbi:MAG: BCSC C-terminal domain-containing protein [Nitrosomonadales bacterium]|nr:BCSC C-terminal domain-containing protein [Nitrosomonadales bacterium]